MTGTYGRLSEAWRAGLAVAALLLAFAPPAAAQEKYPSRRVTLLVGFGPGTVTDSTARLLAQAFQESTGQPFVVENRAGAVGTLAANAVAKATPDGYTLLITTNSTQSAAPALLKSVPYDPIKDFTPIARISGLPQLFVANPGQPFKTIQAMVEFAKANPGKLTYAHANSTAQIAGEALKKRLGLDIARLPYNSTPPAMTDLIAGHIPVMVVDFGIAVPNIKAGKITPLAVLPGERSRMLPDVPTLAETVLPGYDLVGWGGMFGPAGLPADIVALLSDGIGKTLARLQ